MTMRTTILFVFSALSLASATGPPPTGTPPTTPAQPSSTSLPPTSEQCLAPPSQQAANRRYLRQVAYIECQNYHAAQAAAVAGTEGESTDAGRNYNGEEVDARQFGPVLEVGEVIPQERYPDLPALAGLDTYEMLNPDPTYAAFLRGIEMAPSTGPMHTGAIGAGGVGTGMMPQGMWPIVVGALILFARAAGSRRRRAQNGADDAGMKVRLGEGR